MIDTPKNISHTIVAAIFMQIFLLSCVQKNMKVLKNNYILQHVYVRMVKRLLRIKLHISIFYIFAQNYKRHEISLGFRLVLVAMHP